MLRVCETLSTNFQHILMSKGTLSADKHIIQLPLTHSIRVITPATLSLRYSSGMHNEITGCKHWGDMHGQTYQNRKC